MGQPGAKPAPIPPARRRAEEFVLLLALGSASTAQGRSLVFPSGMGTVTKPPQIPSCLQPTLGTRGVGACQQSPLPHSTGGGGGAVSPGRMVGFNLPGPRQSRALPSPAAGCCPLPGRLPLPPPKETPGLHVGNSALGGADGDELSPFGCCQLGASPAGSGCQERRGWVSALGSC